MSRLTAPTHGAAAILNAATIVAYAACFASMVAYQIVQFRRSTGDERQQRSGFSPAAATGLGRTARHLSNTLGFLFRCVVSAARHRHRDPQVPPVRDRPADQPHALVRDRDGSLVGVFVGSSSLATDVLPLSSPVGVAASTLAAAALFNPLRRRVQRLVDRRFNRPATTPRRPLRRSALRLRDAVDLDTVLDELAGTAARSLEPAHVTVWVRAEP